jgi:hypothetical protein
MNKGFKTPKKEGLKPMKEWRTEGLGVAGHQWQEEAGAGEEAEVRGAPNTQKMK